MSFKINMNVEGDTATIRLAGELDGRSAPELNDLVSQAVGRQVAKLVLLLDELTYMSSAGVRCLVFAHQKLPRGSEITLVGTQPEVAETIRLTGFDRSIMMR
ncbi:anti-sigma factor antagonist [Nonomuraea sp. NPDC048882]|jgi:anti-anti-sigma factor|uniref:Anti-sigma factor antagonist n=2 Tax=Nonomuraea TaxID=83681 RepID=A0A2T0ME31_9ACTN|nr:anti-sigma factor antagonist [Nonomuraea fuscirosea]PRX55803.1 anti-anti-sigma factor [Nonomuraea fuscirosea]WSA55646.1 anti-sigma factor antagonist [Nonomuraea fuscirosea]